MSIEDPRLSSIDNTSAADDFDSAVEQHLGFNGEAVDGIEVAQAETPEAGRTDRLPAQTPPVQTAAATIPTEVTPNADNVVTLPAGIELDNLEFQVDGENLILVLADGTEIVVIGGAANIPTFVIGEVELPQVALFAALEGSNINIAAGPDGTFAAQGTPEASRNFQDDPIDNGPENFALAELLGNTDFGDGVQNAEETDDPNDTVPLFGTADAGFVDEDYLEGGNINDGEGDSPSSTIATGSLGIVWGDDDDNAIEDGGLTNSANDRGVAFTQATLDALVAKGYTSDGVALEYAISDDGTTIIAYKPKPDGEGNETLQASVADVSEGNPASQPDYEGEAVFQVSVSDVSANGSYEFELIGNLDHPLNSIEDDITIEFEFSAQDSDGDRGSSSFSVTVNDDSPVIDKSVKTDGVVSEDYLENGNADVENPEEISFNDTHELGILWGADNDFKSEDLSTEEIDDPIGRTLSFSGLDDTSSSDNIIAVIADLAGLSSDGIPLTYRIDKTLDSVTGNWDGGYVLIAEKESEVSQAKIALEGEGSKNPVEQIFTITLDATADHGSYTFELLGNLDHYVQSTVPVDGGNDSPSLLAVEEGQVEVDVLTFDIPFTATDSDGDAITGSFTVEVLDDKPVAVGSETGTVAENDLANFNPLYPLIFDFWQGSNGTSPYDGTTSDNSNTGLLGTVPVWGNLADNILGGADNRGNFNLVSETDAEVILATLGPDGYLTSKGDAINDARMITIDGVGDAMGFFASDGRLVFGLLVAENGTYNFRLFDQVDHPVGDDTETDAPEAVADTVSIDLSGLVTFIDFDGDKIDLGEDVFVISITDDIPTVVGGLEVTLNEGDLDNFVSPVNLLLVALGAPVVGSDGNEKDPDGLLDGLFGTTSASGFLNNLFGDKIVANGADETGSFALVTESRAEALLAEAGWRSNGSPITDARIVTIEGLGQAMGFFTEDGRMVISLALGNGPLGAYDIRVWDQLDHSGHDDLTTEAVETAFEDTLALNLGQFITYTDADGDRIDLDGDVTLKVVDDIPVVVGNLALTLNEGDLSNFLAPVNVLLLALGAPVVGSNGNEQDADGLLDQLFGTTSASGFLNELFGDKIVSAGADEIGRFGLVTEAQAEALLLAAGWSSKGSEITDARMITIEGIGQAMGLFTEDGRMVVSLTLGNGPLGAYDIRIWDQLDHSGHNNPNTAATETAFEDTLALNLGQFITYTDADGDKIGLDGHVTLNVVDDIPEVVGTKTISLDEDDLSSFNPIWSPILAEYLLVQGSNGTDQDPDGLFDDLLGTTSQSGLLNGLIGNKLVSGGADETGKFGLVSEAQAESLLGNLSSKGHAINDVRVLQLPNLGSVLGFFTNDGRLVMTLAVSEAGLYDVRLFDQLDHAYGNNGENHLEIDLSKFVTYTDADGDKIDLGTGTLVLDVKDDAPVASGATVTGTVEEEHKLGLSGEMSHGNEDNDDANGLDRDTTVDVFGLPIPIVINTTNIARGDLDTLVTTGSDEGGAFSLTTDVSGPVMTAGENPVVVTSKGQDVQLDFSGGQIVGFVDVNNNGTYEAGDRQVFTLTANANGGFTFTLLDQVDHTFGDNIEDILTLNLGPAVTYTDKDGDVVTLTSGLNIRVIDDTPIADINLNSNKYLTLDETRVESPSAVGDTNANDEVGAAASPIGATVIGFATDSGAGSLFSNVSKVGADEGMTSSYALKIGNNGASGLFDARTNVAITLEAGTGNLAGMVVGKYGSGATDIAFVIKIDPETGATTVWQYRAVEHNNNGASPDDSVSFANGSLQIEVTVSDSDGDTSKDTVDLGGRIQFQDDGSVITAVETAEIAMNWPVEIATTGDIDVAYGSDGAAATNPLVISGWPTIPGVPAVLSSDGLILTQNSYNGQPLYTLKLDATTGEYEFKLHQEWPDTPSQTISVTSADFASGPQNSGTHTYGDVTFVGVNPFVSGQVLTAGTSGGGAGVGNSSGPVSDANNNFVTNGESFAMTFAHEMQSVNTTFYVGASGILSNPDLQLSWTAYLDGVAVGSGTTNYNNTTGSKIVSIDPAGGDFDKVVFSVTSNAFSYAQVTGLTGATAPIAADDQDLQFQVTATDGDGDKSNKPLIVHLEAVPEVAVTNATVDEAGLPSRTGGSAGTDEAADRNNYDNDVNSEVATGTITISSTDGLGEVRFTNEGNQTTVVSLAQLNGSGTTPVVVFDDATGKLEITGYNAGVISYRYTLEHNVDHGVAGAGALEYTVVAVDPDHFQSFPVKLTITIEDDAPASGGTVQTGSLSETGLPLVDSDFGSLNVNVGADSQNMHVEIKTDSMGKPIINSGLTSDGVSLVYEVRTTNGVDQELVAYKQGESVANPVFIVAVLHPGSFATTLYQNLDHLGDANTTLKLDLVARVFDGDGDYFDRPFSINIADSIPTANDLTAAIGENQSIDITLTEGTNFTFGADSTGTAVSIGTASLSNGPSGVTLGLPTVNFDPNTNKISIVPGTAFDALAAGQTVVLHIPYTVKDGDNDTITKDIAVTVTGTNDAPEISIGASDSAAKEFTEGNAGLTATGTLTVTDVDVANTVTAAVTFLEVSGPDTGTNLTHLALNSYFKVTPTSVIDGSHTSGSLTWEFDSKNQAFDFLAANTRLVLKYTVTVTDSSGATDTQIVEIAIRGTNDGPVLDAVTAINYTDTAADDSFGNATGTLVANDVDLADTKVFGIDGGSVNGNIVTRAGTYGTLSLNIVTGEYTYAPNDTAIERLKAPESEIFTFTVRDASGATASQALTININGANDTAEIGGKVADTVTEDGTLTASGQLTVSDRDASDVGFQTPTSASLAGTYGTFTFDASTGDWTYTLSNTGANVQALNASDTRHDTLTVYSKDGTDSQVIDVTINGANEVVLSPTVNESTSADGRYAFSSFYSSYNPKTINFDLSTLFGAGSYTYSVDDVYETNSNDWLSKTGSTMSGNPDADHWDSYFGYPYYNFEDTGLHVYRVTATSANGAATTYVAFSAIEAAGQKFVISNNGNGANGGLGYASNQNNNGDGDLIVISHNINDPTKIVSVGDGDDVVIGSVYGETIDGGSGDDAIYGMGGNDILRGGFDNDFIDGGDGNDIIYGGSATVGDTNSSGSDVLLGGAGNDTIYGGAGDDILVGGTGADTLKGENGGDLILGDQSDLLIDGGSGDDTLEIERNFTSASDNQIQGIERVILTQAASLDLSNQTEGFKIIGSAGNDTITGGAGADMIYGGLGNDTLRGNGGGDQFRLSTTGGTDTILDYVDGSDKIAFLDTGNSSNGSVDFDDTNGTSSGASLNINDFATRDRISAMQSSLDNKVIRIDNSLSELEITTQKAGTSGQNGSNHAVNNYILVFNSTSGKGEIWFDNDWSDSNMLSRVKVAVLDSVTSLAALKSIDVNDIRVYSDVTDPIILDLDKNGFALSSIDNGVTFDINADGHKDQIAWTSDDGILAYDVDGNGVIDNGSEIFTPDFNGGKFASGVAALASLDGNGDGKIDGSDTAFDELKVWVDANNNGISDEGELSSLSDHDVASISLTTDQTGGEEDGQTIFAEGEFTFEDGSTGNFVEVGFDTIFGSEPEGLTLHGGMGEVVMTGSAGADTFVFDGTALDDLDVADVITDFSSEEGDVLDVTALLDSLLGEQPEATVATHLRATIDEGNTTVSVQTDANVWKDVVVLQNHDMAIKVLFDDQHATVTPHHD